MAPGPLRQAIEDFIETSPPAVKIKTYWQQVKDRQALLFALRDQVLPIDSFKEAIWIIYYVPAGFLFVWFGWQDMYDLLVSISGPISIENIKKSIVDNIAGVFSSPQLATLAETIGALITDPVMNLFEQYSGNDQTDPKNFARAFHGLMTSITTTGAVADAIAEATSMGQIKAVGNMVQSVYWNLGLGFLGWQTMAPILSNGLQPGLERYYRRLYRPNRFSAPELRDLYAMGQITSGELQDEARTTGWRDQDIQQWINLAFRSVAASDVWQAWHEGKRDSAWVTQRLRILGYDPADIPLLFELNPMPAEPEARDVSVSTARQSYHEGLISAGELSAMLQTLRFNPQEIGLILALEDMKIEAEHKRLAVGQIKSAWISNVLTDAEASHWLDLAGFPNDQVKILLDTWKAETVPTFLKVNAGTVVGAYVEHIYNRAEAHAKLVSIGFSEEDASLELNLAELRNPEAFQPPAPPPQKLLTPGVLSELVFYGLMSPLQMHDRLLAQAYTDPDATLLSEAARIRAMPTPKPLPYASIANAYLSAVIGRSTALGKYMDLGYTETSAEEILATIEAQHPEVFGEPEPERIKELNEATLIDLTIAGLLSLAQLRDRLAEINYTPTDIDLVLARVEQLMAPVVRILTQSTVERAYVAGVLTQEQTVERLVSMGFTVEDAAAIVVTVENENPAVFNPVIVQAVRLPTISALVAAVQKGLINEGEYMARAQEIGYLPEDAQMYLALATKNERKATTQLSASQVVSAYGRGFYSYGQSLGFLSQRGYSDADAVILLRIQKDLIENTEAWYGLLQGALTFSDVLTQLINAHYADEDIYKSVSSLPPTTLTALGVSLNELQTFLGEYPGGQ